MLNLNEKEEKKKIKNSPHHSPIDGEDLSHPYIQSTTVLCDNVYKVYTAGL